MLSRFKIHAYLHFGIVDLIPAGARSLHIGTGVPGRGAHDQTVILGECGRDRTLQSIAARVERMFDNGEYSAGGK